MKWYEYLFKPWAVMYRGVSYVLDKAFTFVGDVFGGGSTVVRGATTAVSDICGDVANVTNGIGNAVNSVGSNLPLYLVGGAAVCVIGIIALRGDSGSTTDGKKSTAAVGTESSPTPGTTEVSETTGTTSLDVPSATSVTPVVI